MAQQDETKISSLKQIRTVMVVVGIVAAYSSIVIPSDTLSLAVFIAGLGLVIWGCYLWTKIKGRSWLWALFGLLAPIGLLALLLLSSKNLPPPTPPGKVT